MLKQPINQLTRILAPPVFPEDEDKTRKAKYAHWIAFFLLGTVIFWEAIARIFLGYHGFEVMDVFLIGIAGACLTGLVRLRHGHVRSTAMMLVIIVWTAANGMSAQGFGVKDVTYIVNFTIILMAGLLLSWPAALTVTVLSIVSGIALAFAEESGSIVVTTYPITDFAVSMGMAFLLNAVMIFLLISGLETALNKTRSSVEELGSANAILQYTQSELQNRSDELIVANQELQIRSQKLHGIAEVARTTTSIHSFDQLLPAITSGVSQQLGYYHVGLFLLDEEKQYAILLSANTADGQRMINRGYRVAVGSISPVGYIVQTGIPRVTRMNEDSTFLQNVDFPETRSQIVLPLRSRDEIIGALDIQSREVNAFSEDDLATLSILADQVAIAIKNALLYEQSQAALREADVASRQAASQAWNEYGKTIQTRGYRYDGIKSEPVNDAKQSRRESDSLLIPVQLRDQTIGRLKLKSSDPAREWTDDELSMVRATAERVALALEGARLLEEAQKRARREAFLSDVTAKLGTSFQLDSILRDTVEELGQTLSNSTVTFQLVNPSAPPPADPPRPNGASADGNTVE
ncbi:MAG: GAF domain-containing protein [Anaerolineales bacterium]|nr:GAF domain-containing protein [Anaerolineales bacterium]